MTRKLKLVVTLIGAAVIAGAPFLAAQAGFKDIGPQPTFNWAGPYMGAFAGGAWGSSSFNTNTGNVTSGSYFSSTANIKSVNQNGTGTVSPNAGLGGLLIGTNWQSNRLVYGLEFDASAMNLSKKLTANNIRYPSSLSTYSMYTSMSTNWLATIRARFGMVPKPSWPLLFLTAGAAVTNLHVANQFTDTASSMGFGGESHTNYKAGWTVGAGAEYPFALNWTVNADYLYTHFNSVYADGQVNCHAGFCSGSKVSPYTTYAGLNANIIRLGVNYKFS